MNEIKTICYMCKKQLTAVEEFLNLVVCLYCKRMYWPTEMDRLWNRCMKRQFIANKVICCFTTITTLTGNLNQDITTTYFGDCKR